ncbi:hypothetical protein FACS189426_01530 [Bacteroidia bacterium]|nr:hypothetical protein FACS189426_01530 [Bacteroidia bacterium]
MEVYIMWKHPGFDRSRIDEKAAGIDFAVTSNTLAIRYLFLPTRRVQGLTPC